MRGAVLRAHYPGTKITSPTSTSRCTPPMSRAPYEASPQVRAHPLHGAVVALALFLTLPSVGFAGDRVAKGHAVKTGPEEPAMTERLARALAYEHGEGMPKDQRLAAVIY